MHQRVLCRLQKTSSGAKRERASKKPLNGSADFHKHTQKRGNGVDQSFFMHETDGFVNSDDVCTSFFETKLDQNWAIKNDYNHKMREEEALSSPVSSRPKSDLKHQHDRHRWLPAGFTPTAAEIPFFKGSPKRISACATVSNLVDW